MLMSLTPPAVALVSKCGKHDLRSRHFLVGGSNERSALWPVAQVGAVACMGWSDIRSLNKTDRSSQQHLGIGERFWEKISPSCPSAVESS